MLRNGTKGDYWHFSTVVEIYWGCDSEHLIVQNGLEYVIEGTHAKLTRCNTRETTVFVPTKITFNNQDYLITEIGDIAFVGYDEFGTNNPLIVYCENERNDTPWLDIPYTAYYGVTEDSFIMLMICILFLRIKELFLLDTLAQILPFPFRKLYR